MSVEHTHRYHLLNLYRLTGRTCETISYGRQSFALKKITKRWHGELPRNKKSHKLELSQIFRSCGSMDLAKTQVSSMAKNDILLCFVQCCGLAGHFIRFFFFPHFFFFFSLSGDIDLNGDGEISFHEFQHMMENDTEHEPICLSKITWWHRPTTTIYEMSTLFSYNYSVYVVQTDGSIDLLREEKMDLSLPHKYVCM